MSDAPISANDPFQRKRIAVLEDGTVVDDYDDDCVEHDEDWED